MLYYYLGLAVITAPKVALETSAWIAEKTLTSAYYWMWPAPPSPEEEMSEELKKTREEVKELIEKVEKDEEDRKRLEETIERLNKYLDRVEG